MTKQDRPQMVYVDLDDRIIPVQITMYEKDRAKFAVSLNDAGDAICDAARIFDLLQDVVAQKSDMPAGLYSLLRVCGAHFGRMAERESEDLFSMSHTLRSAAHQAEEFRQKGAK